MIKRPKPKTITPLKESAPWVLVSAAAADTGLTPSLIRASRITLRKFGTADYLRPSDLNEWILNGDNKEEES